MNSINEILSPELQVTPLKEGEKVEFRLILWGQYNPSMNGPAMSGGRGLASRCDIPDPFDKLRPIKQIMNIKSLRPISQPGRETVYEPELESVWFPSSGGITCTYLNNNKYMYLKRHNKNRDNPWRNRHKEAAFFEVNEQKELKKSNDHFEYKMLCGYELVKADDSKIMEIAVNFNEVIGKRSRSLKIDISQDKKLIRSALQNTSQTNPADLLLSMGIDDLVARIMVDTAVEQRWLVFNEHEEKMQWEWLRGAREAGPRKIVQVKDPFDDRSKSLATFLQTKEGSTHFAELKVRHAQYYAVPVTV